MGNLLDFQSPKNFGESFRSTANCNIYSSIKHKTKKSDDDNTFLGIAGYEGIPQNLVINLAAWLILNFLFIILRKKAWNYGRMAVMQKEELKWTDMFYGDDVSIESGGSDNPPHHVPYGHNQTPLGAAVTVIDRSRIPLASEPVSEAETVPEHLTGVESSETDKGNNNSRKDDMGNVVSASADSSAHRVGNISEIKDTGYFHWIKIVFTLTDQQYREKCGHDCVSYLSFQRHLIVLAIIITCCTMLIILPINMHVDNTFEIPDKNGTVVTDTVSVTGFAKTTIINLANGELTKQGKSYVNFLWAHVVLSIIFLFISIWVMRRYSKGLQFSEDDTGHSESSHSICIIGLNKAKCHEDILRAHLMETYPETEILEVSFAYNISKLQALEFNRLSAFSAKVYFEHVLEGEMEKNGRDCKRPILRPYLCGIMGCCFARKHWGGKCGCKETDAIEYYTKLEQKYIEDVDKERKKALTTPLGIAFVTFDSTEAAERIVEDYACSARVLLHTPESKYTKELNSNHWIVRFAPVPQDIYWQNLTLDFKMWYFKFTAINLLLAVITIMFTTPVYIFNTLVTTKSEINIKEDTEKAEKELPLIASALVDTLPTAIVWVLGISLISLVYQSDVLVGYWTKTAGNLSEMIKVFFFLTFMVIILPSLGITSISYFFSQNQGSVSWSCIFYKENGALFVNYVVTSSLTGTAAELMRLPELFLYAVKLCFARSAAEVGAIRKSVLWDFQIGSNYAWMMLHFAIFTCFSVIYPLVTPFGLLYLILKHLVDRYNIYFAYAPCKVEKEVHATAVNFVIMSMFMLQINLLAYLHFHIGGHSRNDGSHKDSNSKEISDLRYLQVFSLLGFSVTAALFLGQVCFNVCADFSPIHQFKNMITDRDEVLAVGRASSIIPQTNTKVQAVGSHDQGSQTRGKRSSKEGNEPKRTTHPKVSTIQVSPDGQLRVIPFEPEAETQSSFTAGTGYTSAEARTSLIVSSNYTGSGKPYGRYIPPLLRPEFIKLVLESRNQAKADQVSSQPENRLQVISEKSEKAQTEPKRKEK